MIIIRDYRDNLPIKYYIIIRDNYRDNLPIKRDQRLDRSTLHARPVVRQCRQSL